MIGPLDPLKDVSSIARLLKSAPAEDVRAEISRLDWLPLEPLAVASREYARGALAQREGSLDAAHANLAAAAPSFEMLGEVHAGKLAACEAILSTVRRGPRTVYKDAIASLERIAKGAGDDLLVAVVATHYRGTAERLLGDAQATQKSLLWALERSTPFLEERAKILNSLGTLYVVMGAHGAAQSLLEHAAELHQRHGDVIGEAISYGQLGSAALALGDLERARKFLQRQEWLSSRVGDVFGQARSLIFLADVALSRGRPDDALPLAQRAKELALNAKPPLRLWVAYATRAMGRARLVMGDKGAHAELEAAAAIFADVGNPLGTALTGWDRARRDAQSEEPTTQRADFFRPAWQLAALGMSGRVSEVLRDERLSFSDEARASERSIAAAAQGLTHLTVGQEVELLYAAPEELASIADQRTAAMRNLARLSALALAPRGLIIAAAASGSATAAIRNAVLPNDRTNAVAIADIPGLVVWAWPMGTAAGQIGRDLAVLRGMLGADSRVALVRFPEARVISGPLAGEVGPRIEAPAFGSAIFAACALPGGALLVAPDIAWDQEAETHTSGAGFTTQRGA
ncbi:MAG TPA: tetratricopeptide repeat protein [Polyangium sp.]|nr:tetratricopeptide repeat protein [Polyangium sp.]